MNRVFKSKVSKLMDGLIRPFFVTIRSKVRNFIKEKVFGNIVREMIAEYIIMSQQQQQAPPAFPPPSDALPYGIKIRVIKGYFAAQNHVFGQVSEEDFMNKLKDLSYKEVLELYDSIDKMNVSVVQKEEFSFDKVKEESKTESLRLQKELDERGVIHIEKELDEKKDE